jgi:hypothetical protein
VPLATFIANTLRARYGVFSGSYIVITVTERLLVISYSSITKGDLSAGSLTLYGNTYGTTFPGNWGGLEEGKVVSSLRSNKKLSLEKDHDFILAIVRSKHTNIISSDNGSGKSRSIDLHADIFFKGRL